MSKDNFVELPAKINVDDFYKHKLINLKNRTNKSDSILCILAFVFDLYFKESFITLNELKYLDNYIEGIKVDESVQKEFNEYINEINKYVEERI